jgi:hypothetical protein
MSRLLSYCGHCRQSAKPRLCREPDTGIGRTIACLAIALHDLAEEPAVERDRLGLVELTARVAVIEDVQHLEFVDISGRQFGAGFQIVRVIVWDGQHLDTVPDHPCHRAPDIRHAQDDVLHAGAEQSVTNRADKMRDGFVSRSGPVANLDGLDQGRSR